MTTTPDNILRLVRDAEIEAAEAQRPPRVSILAYGGGIMKVSGWGNLAIDLAGLEATKQVPILADHNSALEGIVGHGEAVVRDHRLYVAGVINDHTEAAKQVVELAKGGFAFQASVGVEPMEPVRLAANEQVQVNNRTLVAPVGGMVLIRKGRLREVSITALACDSGTSVAIAAAKTGAQEKRRGNMDGKEKTNEVETGGVAVIDPVVTERQRAVDITRICGGKFPDIQAKAMSEGWDSTRTELEVLRASRPKAPISVWPSQPITTPEVIEAALAFRMGLGKVAEKHMRPEVLEQAHHLGVTHALDLCRMALIADGKEIPGSRDAMVRAALSTYSLPTALGDLASKSLLDAYADAPASWRSFAAIRSVPDFKTHTAIRPSFTGPLEEVAPGGELKHGSVSEWTASFKVDTFGKLLSIDRRDLVNDDLSVFAEASSALGRTALRKLNDLVYQVLLANAGSFFSSGNGNYLSGAESALSMDSLAAAIRAMLSQRDAEGNDLDIRPATLLVTPALEPTARALLESEYIMAQANLPTGNSLKNVVKLEIESRLANTAKYGSAASDKHWYLFSDPGAAAFVVAFLNGKQEPTVEFFGLDQEVDRLAVSWRVYHDFGAALIDPRAAVRSKGQA